MALASDDSSAAPLSDTLQRALDALVDGRPIPDDARARLSDAERAHLAGLVATSALTRTVLGAPAPTPASEEASLKRAQERVAAAAPRPGVSGKAATAGDPAPARTNWLVRWWRKQRSHSNSKNGHNEGGQV